MAGTEAASNPYVGPRPFEPGETLHGRGRDVAELYYLLSAERIVLFHSPSGAGKTSLIQAGLIPRLRSHFDIWRPTRLNQEPALRETDGGRINRYVLSAVQGLEEGVPAELRRPIEVLADQSLAQYVTGRPRRPSSALGVVLVFDQFEEVLTIDPLALEAKREFFDQLGDLLHDPEIWALFVLREEYLAGLDPYAEQVPTHLKNRFRISLLGLEQARRAIVKPAEEAGREFTRRAVERLLHDLATIQAQRVDGVFVEETGHHVEPMQLQVVCRRLWEQLPEEKRSIDSEDLRRFGDVTEALAVYYAGSVAQIAGVQLARERAVREWFGECLITKAGIRAQVVRGSKASGGLDNEIVQRLLDAHLIRAEKRAGTTWYELAHDRLLEPVQRNNARWRELHLSRVQHRAALWDRQGSLPGLLFKDKELAEAERWAADHASELTEVELRFFASCREAQLNTERERKQARLIRRLAIVSTIVSTVALVAGVVAGAQWLQAAGQKEKAEEQWRRAEVQSERAEEEKQRAKAQSERAEEQKRLAEAQALRVEEQREEAEEQQRRAENLARVTIASNLLAAGDATLGNLVALEVQEPDETQTGVATLRQALTVPVELLILKGHNWFAETLVSPGTSQFMTASGKTAWIWNAQTGKEIAILRGHGKRISAASFSPDGLRAVTAAEDGWARIWNAETGQETSTLMRHEGPVRTALFSADGSLVVTVADDGKARISNAQTGESIANFLHGNVSIAAFSPQGHQLIMIPSWSSRLDTAQIWNAQTGIAVATLQGHTSLIESALFSPDGSRVATASLDRTARIWNAQTGEKVVILMGHRRGVRTASFSPDGSLVVTASDDGTARIWNSQTGEEIVTFQHTARVRTATFSKDGSRVLTASDDESVRVWNARVSKIADGEAARIINALAGKEIATIQNLSNRRAAFLSADGSRVITVKSQVNLSYSQTSVWNVQTGEELATLQPAQNRSFSADGSRVVFWNPRFRDSWIRFFEDAAQVWNFHAGERFTTLKGHTRLNRSAIAGPGQVVGASFGRDSSRIVSSVGDETARIWNGRTGDEIVTLKVRVSGSLDQPPFTNLFHNASFSPDASQVVAAIGGRGVRIWNVQTGDEIVTLEGRLGSLPRAFFSAGGSRVVTAPTNGRQVQVWDPQTGEEVAILKGHQILDALFGADGTRIVTASRDKTARIWVTETGKEVATLQGHTGQIIDASFSADGTQVVTASKDGTARIWDVQTSEAIAVLEGHMAWVLDASFSADGFRVVTVSGDKTARIWNLQTGKEIATLRGHTASVREVLFSADGSQIATVSDDGTARSWANTDNYIVFLQSRIRARTRLCLTASFRQVNLGESAVEAERNSQACKECGPVFFERLGGAQSWEWQIYEEAWRVYQECLDCFRAKAPDLSRPDKMRAIEAKRLHGRSPDSRSADGAQT